ncbi:MAG: LUD domain-containing protein [Anaerolineae bacterium]|nr:LUD domain-containing protein [Phycisphaerae bacterium]
MIEERENILARVREALRSPAHKPPSRGGEPRDWLPVVESVVDLFRANAADLRAAFHLTESQAAWAPLLRERAIAEGWKRVATHRGALTDAVVEQIALPTLQTDDGYDTRDLERCDVGITECDALIAQTGSVLITSRSAGGRALSVLPPHHVVLARRDQLIADLPAAFALIASKYANNYPSFISLITGPSRTGDIERILVLGAHGPKKLTILCA